ncbi:unnamed protein product [Callosobruchus maculatus]|uniref:Uncharacterized protein n=1 Tax=Callosobruchus maculatus TaxID=64391 RepID=A0A653DND8_CALMS|nr:unnamed protein product [Callosobruchus maculatus]
MEECSSRVDRGMTTAPSGPHYLAATGTKIHTRYYFGNLK